MRNARGATVIALVCSPEVGAAAKRLDRFVHALTDDGYAVRVVTQIPNYPHGRILGGYPRRPVVVEQRGGVTLMRVCPVLLGRRSLLWRSLSELWFALWAAVLASVGARPRFIFVTTPSVFTPFAGWAASRLRRVPLIVEVRDLTWKYAAAVRPARLSAASLLKVFVMAFIRRAALVVCTNEYQQEYLIREGVAPSMCVVARNGADGDLIDRMRAAHAAGDPFHLMYVGLIGHAQGLQVLVEVARLLAPDPRFRISVIGDGPERSTLMAQADDLGLRNIDFPGPVAPSELPATYARAGILIAHLRGGGAFHEALPSKVFEYMAAAKPIIFGGTGPGADVVREAEAGLAVPSDDPVALADAARHIASGHGFGDRLGAAGFGYLETDCRAETARRALLGAIEAACRR